MAHRRLLVLGNHVGLPRLVQIVYCISITVLHYLGLVLSVTLLIICLLGGGWTGNLEALSILLLVVLIHLVLVF